MQKTSTITTKDTRVAEIRAEVPEGATQREAITVNDVITFVNLCEQANIPIDTVVMCDDPLIGFSVLTRLRAEREVEV